jgi:hypothetical protein
MGKTIEIDQSYKSSSYRTIDKVLDEVDLKERSSKSLKIVFGEKIHKQVFD